MPLLLMHDELGTAKHSQRRRPCQHPPDNVESRPKPVTRRMIAHVQINEVGHFNQGYTYSGHSVDATAVFLISLSRPVEPSIPESVVVVAALIKIGHVDH